MARRAAGAIGCLLLVALVLLSPVSPAQARGCYPPPCGAPAATGSEAGAVPAVTLDAGGRRGPAPFVAAGLLVVAATLGTLCHQRKAALAAPARVATAPPPAPRFRRPAGRREPERSLR